MKSAMVLTGSGPILVLTSYDSLESRDFAEKLAARGIGKFIAHEVSLEQVRNRYGTRFSVIAGDLSAKDDLRVMDIDGHHVFNNFSFEDLGVAIYSSPEQKSVREPGEEAGMERERLYVKLDEYGVVTESSYLPVVGARVTPLIEPANAPEKGHFQIDEQGIIVNASPGILNGRKLISYGKVSPALGRTDATAPASTWKSDDNGGLICA